jgi:hypothetical protein
MRCVTTDEHAPIAEFVGKQAAANPILLRQDLVFEVRADAQNLPDAAIAIDRCEVCFVGT